LWDGWSESLWKAAGLSAEQLFLWVFTYRFLSFIIDNFLEIFLCRGFLKKALSSKIALSNEQQSLRKQPSLFIFQIIKQD
jgi:hypothetical protein